MAKLEHTLSGKFDQLLNKIEDGILNGSMSASLEDSSDFLSGHAHGGQFRLPFVGGLVALNQGLFREYDAGLCTEENTNMIVSRGIGNSILPFRFNNRPEVILIELKYNG